MWPNYSVATRKAVNDLLKKGGSLSAYRANKDFGSGPTDGSYAWRLEREIEKRFHVKHAIAVNSGTAALHSALAGLDLRGGEVVTSPYTFSATASAILLAGGIPVFADVDPHTFCITKETVSRVISKRTKAILPVHLFGGLADVRELASYGLPVIEDACQAVGARNSAGYSGTQGLGGAYSFNGGKNIPAGESGCFTTNDGALAEKARLLMNHAENFGADYVGLNYRPNELTCCVAYHGLLELEERNQRRIDLAKRVKELLHEQPGSGRYQMGYNLPRSNYAGDHVFYCFPFTCEYLKDPWPGKRETLIKFFAKKGIHVGAGYIQPTLNHYKAFRKYAQGPLPVVEELSGKTLCLLYCLSPDKPLSYAEHVAKCMRESLE
jgi:dTDP-4-amino-4,6-dideoxygalactose transaminase